MNNALDNLLLLLGRLGLSAIFISSGLQKVGGYAGTQQYMEAAGVPGLLLPLVIALEVGGGLAVAAGLFTRWAALALAGFTLVAAALFHAELADPMQAIAFWKNVAIAGGFLILAVSGPGAFSLQGRGARARLVEQPSS
jgi:putative oxidoreductase